MALRWPVNSPEKRIEAFIGAWGVKTGDIADGDHLLELASRLFEVENTGLADRMAAQIERLGKKERKRLAGKNLVAVMGEGGRLGVTGQRRAASAVVERPTTAMLERMMEASQPDLIDGEPFDVVGQLDLDPAKLLQKVVSAVISAGRADILWEFPEVLAFFGSRIPQREEVAHLHDVDQRMFDAADKWPNRRHGA